MSGTENDKWAADHLRDVVGTETETALLAGMLTFIKIPQV